jgi:hypothetical protein
MNDRSWGVTRQAFSVIIYCQPPLTCDKKRQDDIRIGQTRQDKTVLFVYSS